MIMIYHTRHIDRSSMSPRSSSIYDDFPRSLFFFRSVFPSFGAAAAAVDSAINPRDQTIIFPIVVLRNYSSLRSRPNVRCLQVSCRFHRDFRNSAIKFTGRKRRAFHYVDRQDTESVLLSFASMFTLERAKISIFSKILTFCNYRII